MHTYKTLMRKTGLSHTNLRQYRFTGALPEPDDRVGISPVWKDDNPGLVAFLAAHARPEEGPENGDTTPAT